MTLKEAARIARKDVRTLTRWISAGILHVERTPQGHRISSASLAAAQKAVALKRSSRNPNMQGF